MKRQNLHDQLVTCDAGIPGCSKVHGYVGQGHLKKPGPAKGTPNKRTGTRYAPHPPGWREWREVGAAFAKIFRGLSQ